MNYLAVFDLETTGLDKSKDFIIQFAGIKIDRSTNKVIDELNLYIQPSGSYTISIAAYFKHKINAEFLKDKPFMKDVAPQIIKFLDGCDILTYNGTSFDIPFLKQELVRCGLGDSINFSKINCYDAFLEEKRRNGNTLEQTYQRYAGKSMIDAGLTAHDAYSDIKATYSIFFAQQSKNPYGPEEIIGEDSVLKMLEFQDKLQPCFTLGKYRQVGIELVSKIDQNYLNWAVSDKCSFSESTKEFIKQYINN